MLKKKPDPPQEEWTSKKGYKMKNPYYNKSKFPREDSKPEDSILSRCIKDQKVDWK